MVVEPTETKNRPFLTLQCAHTGIEAWNLRNMLKQKSVKNKIPPYVQYKNSP